MVLEYKWNPFDDISFDYGENIVPDIKGMVDILSDNDILDAIRSYEKYLERGSWPLDDSLMHKIREKANIEEENKQKTLIQIYNMIAQEACRRMLQKYEDLTE